MSQIVYYNCDYDEINLVDNVPNINENDMVSVKKELDNKKLECDLLNNQISILKKIIDDKNDVIKGQRIAESRAKINMWKTYNSNISYILGFSVGRHINFIMHEKQHLRDLINDVKTK